jgi:hypothetical protein
VLNKYSDLSAEQEALVSTVIGCAIAVHRALGPGFKECIYHRAFRLELDSRGIPFGWHPRLVFWVYVLPPVPASGRRPTGSCGALRHSLRIFEPSLLRRRRQPVIRGRGRRLH